MRDAKVLEGVLGLAAVAMEAVVDAVERCDTSALPEAVNRAAATIKEWQGASGILQRGRLEPADRVLLAAALKSIEEEASRLRSALEDEDGSEKVL